MTATVESTVLDQPPTLVIPKDITNVETVEQLTQAATPFFQEAEPLCVKAREIVVSDEDDRAGMKLAGDTRKAIAKVRIAAEKKRKELKEESLRNGQAIDKIFNGFGGALEAHEEYLAAQEKYAERIAADRAARVKSERDGRLVGLGVDPANYQTGHMTEEAFASCVAGIEAQRKAEAARAAEQARKESCWRLRSR